MRSLCIPALLLLFAVPAWADGDHDRARHAVEEGRILPLRDILADAQTTTPGELIEAELEDEHGQLVYEIKILSPDGRLTKLHYDAQTGKRRTAKGREPRP